MSAAIRKMQHQNVDKFLVCIPFHDELHCFRILYQVLDLMIAHTFESVLSDRRSSYVPAIMLQPMGLRSVPTDKNVP
jgi:hypothetical protein